jgi:hypothetical protein
LPSSEPSLQLVVLKLQLLHDSVPPLGKPCVMHV